MRRVVLLLAMLAQAAAFLPPSSMALSGLRLRGSLGSNLNSCSTSSSDAQGLVSRRAGPRGAAAAGGARPWMKGAQGLGMISTPPRRDADEDVLLDSIRDNLDSQFLGSSGSQLDSSSPNSIFKPKAPKAVKKKDNVMRSPCTSLYGNWRPTTGTESFKTASSAQRAKASSASNAQEPKKEGRKRPPPVQKKKAVKSELLPEFVARAQYVLKQSGGSMDSNLFGQSWKQTHLNSPLNGFKGVKGVTIHQMLRENGKFFTVSDTDRQKVKFFELKAGAVDEYLAECSQSGIFVHDVAANPALAAPPVVLKAEAEEEEEEVEVGDAEQEIIQGVQKDLNDFAIPEEFANLEFDEESSEDPVAASVPAASMDSPIYSEIPVQGKARHMALDRRVLKAKRVMQPEKKREERREEDAPAPPQSTPDDAAETPVIALYNSWAVDGRDVVMEITHRSAFDEMWAWITEKVEERGEPLTIIDAGCGNGWAARMMAEHELVDSVTAVDGAALMIEKAVSSDQGEGHVEYVIGDVETWEPEAQTDLVHMVESLYLLDDPEAAVKHMVDKWLQDDGRFIASLDCYKENKLSHTWEEDMGVTMHCWSEKDWARVLKKAGLKDIELWRAKTSGPWQGPLIATGVKA